MAWHKQARGINGVWLARRSRHQRNAYSMYAVAHTIARAARVSGGKISIT